MNLKRKSTLELLRLISAVVAELKHRAVIRAKNFTGDYAEFLAARALKLKSAPISTPGFDGTDSSGIKYEVKGRQWTLSNKSRQFGVIRRLNSFDQMVGIVLGPDWTVDAAAVIPPKIVKQFATWSEHQNGYILHGRDDVMKHPEARDITSQVTKAQISAT